MRRVSWTARESLVSSRVADNSSVLSNPALAGAVCYSVRTWTFVVAACLHSLRSCAESVSSRSFHRIEARSCQRRAPTCLDPIAVPASACPALAQVRTTAGDAGQGCVRPARPCRMGSRCSWDRKLDQFVRIVVMRAAIPQAPQPIALRLQTVLREVEVGQQHLAGAPDVAQYLVATDYAVLKGEQALVGSERPRRLRLWRAPLRLHVRALGRGVRIAARRAVGDEYEPSCRCDRSASTAPTVCMTPCHRTRRQQPAASNERDDARRHATFIDDLRADGEGEPRRSRRDPRSVNRPRVHKCRSRCRTA